MTREQRSLVENLRALQDWVYGDLLREAADAIEGNQRLTGILVFAALFFGLLAGIIIQWGVGA